MPRIAPLRPAVWFSFGILLAVAPGPAAAEPATGSALIRATDLLKLRKLETPVLSPDGRWVAYVVLSAESKAGAKDDWVNQSHLWLAAADGSTPPRQLTHDAASDTSPVWEPTGDQLAFVRTVEKEKPQVWVMSLAGGDARPLTHCETGASDPRWAPDGRSLLFTSPLTYARVRAELVQAGVDARPSWKAERPGRTANDTANWGLPEAAKDPPKVTADPDGPLPERREWLARNEAAGNPRILDRLNFLSESDLDPELTFTHIFVQDAQPGAAAQDVTPGYTGYAAPEWMADGKAIVCVGPRDRHEHPDRSEFTSLYLADATGHGVKVFADLPGCNLRSPIPSPDGKTVACTATPGERLGYGQAMVATVAATGGTPKLLTEKLDRNAGDLRWSPDSRFVYFIAPSQGEFPLYRVEMANGATAKVAGGGWRAYDLGRDRRVEVLTTPSDPYELYASGLSDGKAGEAPPARLSQHNGEWLQGKRLSAYEPHSLVVKDGLKIDYWTMKPAGYVAGKKYPLLLEIHGGPAYMWGPGEDTMWFEFQYFAARGFALVFANPRGSGGYGHDFQRANFCDWGIGPSGDILNAVDFAAKEPWVDRAREVVTGGSYGGYMTAWIIGHDHRFKAAVAQRGVYDLPTFFGEGNAWRLVPRAFGGYPWQPDVRHLLERDSPLTYVTDITTPLLIQHGDSDRRTGFVQSEMLFKSLKVLGRDVEEARYPRATHELSRSGEPGQRLDTLVRYEEFFRRYLGEN